MPNNPNAPAPEILTPRVKSAQMAMPRVRAFDENGEGPGGRVLDVFPHSFYGHAAIVKWDDGRVDPMIPFSWLVMADEDKPAPDVQAAPSSPRFAPSVPEHFDDSPTLETRGGHSAWDVGGVIWIADQSGRTPYHTDDGPLAIDPTREITIEARGKRSVAFVPVYSARNPKAKGLVTPMSLADAEEFRSAFPQVWNAAFLRTE